MELNCLGEACPLPVIKTKKALNDIGENGVISVLVDNIEAIENIEKMVKDMGYNYTTGETDGNYVITITKGDGEVLKNEKSGNNTVIVISSDKMGRGDDELGAALLKTFLYTLTESDTLPKTIIFYNGGVKMTTEGSAAINDITALLEMGVDILSCGACLKHYGLTDSLKVGRVSNMYEIASLMLNASSVITP